MHTLNIFDSRNELDTQLANSVAQLLAKAIADKGKASIAVSGGSTPKGFFNALSQIALPWNQVTVTLADERWVDIDSEASNTRLVFENLIQNKAVGARFFHLKQGDELTDEVLSDLNVAVNTSLLPFDVVILGMGEDGHTASLFPCSAQINQCLAENSPSLISVQPETAPHKRITFSYQSLKQCPNIFLQICGENKRAVLNKALEGHESKEMPIRAFLHSQEVNTQVFWAE